ncbi:MAG: hypothetical protein FJZ59_05400 [Chlamydiae bacterium]|nr:hypothetical protein [Chlamydiota bacterium]
MCNCGKKHHQAENSSQSGCKEGETLCGKKCCNHQEEFCCEEKCCNRKTHVCINGYCKKL